MALYCSDPSSPGLIPAMPAGVFWSTRETTTTPFTFCASPACSRTWPVMPITVMPGQRFLGCATASCASRSPILTDSVIFSPDRMIERLATLPAASDPMAWVS